MPVITVTKSSPLGSENLVFALNASAGLGLLNPPLLSQRTDKEMIKGEAGPAVPLSSLTSVLYRSVVCVFGVVRGESEKQPGFIAMLSPVYHPLPKYTTTYTCISAVTSSDGEECWIFYRDLDGTIQQLKLSDMGVEEVSNPGHISPGTSLAAFMSSSGAPSVVYQDKKNIIHAAKVGGDLNILEVADLHPARPNTRMSIAIRTVANVDTVYLYYVGLTGYLKRLKPDVGARGKEPASIVLANTLKQFEEVNFTAVGDGEGNTIYYLEGDKLRSKPDPYIGMGDGGGK